MELEELKKLNKQELHKTLESYRENLRVLRFKVASNQHKKVHEVKRIKRTFARILTLLNK